MNPLLEPDYAPNGTDATGLAALLKQPGIKNKLLEALGPEQLGYYLGPHAYKALAKTGELAGYLTPQFGKNEAVEAGKAAGEGSYGKAAAYGGLGLLGAGADMLPGGPVVKRAVGGLSKLPALLEQAKDAAPAVLGMMAGPMAKTADKAALAKAESMLTAGAGRDEIWNKTGWFKGADDKWRFEISDHKTDTKGYIQPGSEYEGTLGEIIKHPDAYKAYPDMQDMHSTYGQIKGANGAYGPVATLDGVESIAIGSETPRSTGLHEMQHAIQYREGFARGGNPSDPTLRPYAQRMVEQAGGDYERSMGLMRSHQDQVATRAGVTPTDPGYTRVMKQSAEEWRSANPELAAAQAKAFRVSQMPPSSRAAYPLLAGEVEARNVQKRMDMTPDQRQATPPWLTQDVPDLQQIIRLLSQR